MTTTSSSCLSHGRAVSNSGSDREPSQLAARRNTPRCSEDQNVWEPWGPLRAGTARGPASLMQPCGRRLLPARGVLHPRSVKYKRAREKAISYQFI